MSPAVSLIKEAIRNLSEDELDEFLRDIRTEFILPWLTEKRRVQDALHNTTMPLPVDK